MNTRVVIFVADVTCICHTRNITNEKLRLSHIVPNPLISPQCRYSGYQRFKQQHAHVASHAKLSLTSPVSAQVSDKLLSAADVPMMEYRFFGVLAPESHHDRLIPL